MKQKTKDILKDLDNDTQPPKNCDKCGFTLREVDLFSGFDYDVHPYKICTGYSCPNCGHTHDERTSM